jgi:hypothetical protein
VFKYRSKNVAGIRVIEGLTVGVCNIHTTVLIYTQEKIIVEKIFLNNDDTIEDACYTSSMIVSRPSIIIYITAGLYSTYV